jgi:hypothetical protein
MIDWWECLGLLSPFLSLTFWLYNPLDLGCFFSYLILYTVGRIPWTGDQLVARPLPTQKTTQTQNKHTQTSMPRKGFEPTIPIFERPKSVHASDRAATVIGMSTLKIETVWSFETSKSLFFTPLLMKKVLIFIVVETLKLYINIQKYAAILVAPRWFLV